MSDITVVVEPREEVGKNANRRLRASGSVPAVVYGGGKDAVPIKVDERTMRDFLKETGSENMVFLLKLGDTGKSRHAMIRDLQIDTVDRRICHIDFQRVLLVQVPQRVTGLDHHLASVGAHRGCPDAVARPGAVRTGRQEQSPLGSQQVGADRDQRQQVPPAGPALLASPGQFAGLPRALHGGEEAAVRVGVRARAPPVDEVRGALRTGRARCQEEGRDGDQPRSLSHHVSP